MFAFINYTWPWSGWWHICYTRQVFFFLIRNVCKRVQWSLASGLGWSPYCSEVPCTSNLLFSPYFKCELAWSKALKENGQRTTPMMHGTKQSHSTCLRSFMFLLGTNWQSWYYRVEILYHIKFNYMGGQDSMFLDGIFSTVVACLSALKDPPWTATDPVLRLHSIFSTYLFNIIAFIWILYLRYHSQLFHKLECHHLLPDVRFTAACTRIHSRTFSHYCHITWLNNFIAIISGR